MNIFHLVENRLKCSQIKEAFDIHFLTKMPNYFTDNADILFQFDNLPLLEIAEIQERETPNGDADFLPENLDDVVDNYRRVLSIIGEITAETIAPNSEQVDKDGNTHNADEGTVSIHPLVQENFNRLAQADMMGFTIPRKYGGLNCPITIYTMATEIVSRGDCSFMNMFGLQGIADTIYAFASDEMKDKYLPLFADGSVSGAMALTEPDAGSDLQAVRLRADLDEDGTWRLGGVKRFITNGCGDILLVLARSEPTIADGRGLSLFLCEKSPAVKVRCLEKKLGIHGSPTCEIVFDNAPALLIGDRQRGLITYVLALMNGARLGIAAQSLGVAEAAFRLARVYGHSRQQFGAPIERLAPVAEMIVEMQIAIEASRALTYQTAISCDHENNANRLVELAPNISDTEKKVQKQKARALKRINAMLTPMSKYYGAEMAISVTNTALQVLGGSGFITDYPAERYLRDARITSIYEGTSQLQVVAAIKGVTSGTFAAFVEDYEKKTFANPLLEELKNELISQRKLIMESVEAAKNFGGQYIELVARQLVESAIAVIVGHLFLAHGEKNVRKERVANYFIRKYSSINKSNCERVCSGNTQTVTEYDLLAGPVPSL